MELMALAQRNFRYLGGIKGIKGVAGEGGGGGGGGGVFVSNRSGLVTC